MSDKTKCCPECGSSNFTCIEGFEETHRLCICGQEWFADLEYADINIEKLRATLTTREEQLRDMCELIEKCESLGNWGYGVIEINGPTFTAVLDEARALLAELDGE